MSRTLEVQPTPSTSSRAAAAPAVYVNVTPRVKDAILKVINNQEFSQVGRIHGCERALRTMHMVRHTFLQELRAEIALYKSETHVPWDLLDRVCTALRDGPEEGSPRFYELVAEAGIHVPPPPERARSKELEERIQRLREEQEDRRGPAPRCATQSID